MFLTRIIRQLRIVEQGELLASYLYHRTVGLILSSPATLQSFHRQDGDDTGTEECTSTVGQEAHTIWCDIAPTQCEHECTHLAMLADTEMVEFCQN